MKKFLLFFVLLLIFVSFGFQQQKKIVEEVSVEWWAIPVFAIDSSGKSVTDLDSSDIEITVDNRKIETFTLLKKDFTASEQPGKTEIVNTPIVLPTVSSPTAATSAERTKNVFLLFDTVLSSKDSTENAKIIARKIIESSEKNIRFFIMVIEPFSGLHYIGGQTNDKKILTDIIDKKVKGRLNSRIPNSAEIVNNMPGKDGEKYDPEDFEFFKTQIGAYYIQKNQSFAQSFESLYYALNTIKDNKYIYLFSEGISNAMQKPEYGARSIYQYFLTNSADYIGRSGAVVFIINTGIQSNSVSDSSDVSGVASLKLLAEKSGGKFLEGKGEEIIEKIENLHHAYYEVFFPATPNSKNGALKISIQAKRKGVDIHTMKTAEKNRDYNQMEEIERQVLALNLVYGNPLYKTGFTQSNAEIADISKKKDSVSYDVTIPDSMINRNVDLYKVWVSKKETDTRVENEPILNTPRKLKINFKNVKPSDETYFVLVDSAQKFSLLHGIKTEETPVSLLALPEETNEWFTPQSMEKEQKKQKPEDKKELGRLLQGAAVYCENLKNAAFHYICTEKIVETLKPLTQSKDLDGDITSYPLHPIFSRVMPMDPAENPIVIKSNKEEFHYRLIKKGNNVKELREMTTINIDESEKEKLETQGAKIPEEKLKTIRFLSSKAVFGPITLLDTERQTKYNFHLVGHEKIQNRDAAVIEAAPKNEKDAQFIYGKFWIDTEDFSILKIKANPNSILGYDKLRNLAKELNSRLQLTLETEYYKFREGIRFPTRIHFEEQYKGGPFLTSYVGTKGWIRTQSITTYDDYMFFDVDTEVTYEPIKK